LHFIDSHEGNIRWDLGHACQELRLDISGAHAARLFKRYIGLGVREYAKKKRLLMAAERLKTTDLPVKAIASEFGYPNRAYASEEQLLDYEWTIKRILPPNGSVRPYRNRDSGSQASQASSSKP